MNTDIALDPATLAALLERTGDDVRLLDVRTPGEHTTAHIAGSYNVPLDELGEHAGEIRTLSTPVVLICQSGQRANRAQAVLSGSGMKQLRVLEGGMQAWLAAGLPVRRGPSRISLERQVRVAAGFLTAVGTLLTLVISPWFGIVPALVGSGLMFSGITDTCGMAMLLARLPYNRSSADVGAAVRALLDNAGAPAATRTDAGCCR